MTDQPPHRDPSHDPGLPRKNIAKLSALRIAAAVFLIVERASEAFSAALLWLCAFICLWLFEIPEVFGRFVELIVSGCFLAGMVLLLVRGVAAFRMPGRDEITRRIETDSDLPHRPLAGLEDRLANRGAPQTGYLWQHWRDQLAVTLQRLVWPRPKPVLARVDPYALRGLMLVVLVAALTVAGGTWRGRIMHGLLPVVPVAKPGAVDDAVMMWVTPPDYTGLPQIVLKGDGGGKSISVPEGSVIKARVSGGIGKPSLVFSHAAFKMATMGHGSYGVEEAAQPTQILKIRQFMWARAKWRVNYVPDLPPKIALKGEPKVNANGEITVPLTLQDDYSVETISAHISLDPEVNSPPPIGTAVDSKQNVMSAPKAPMDYTGKFDLAWHPWAGMKAVMDLEVRDHKGQTARITGLELTLPERQFRQPLAQQLVSIRKRLIWTPKEAAHNAAFDIETIMIHPTLYQGDISVFLSLRSMASHLIYDDSVGGVAQVVSQLWDTALRIEDGGFSMAKRNLQQAQRALQDALKDPNAKPEEIAALMEQMRMAMAQYMQESFAQMQKRMAEKGIDPQAMAQQQALMKNINMQDLAAFLDKMQAEAMAGNKAAAAEMASQVDRLMQMMDPNNAQAGMPPDMQAMMDGVNRLQEIVERQTKLLDGTRQETASLGEVQGYAGAIPEDKEILRQLGLSDAPPSPQETMKGQEAPKRVIDTAAEAKEQDAIRKMLDDAITALKAKVPKVPVKLDEAEREMQESAQALGADKPVDSIPHQDLAIKDLTQAQQEIGQQLTEKMKQMMMFSFGMGQTDPLGHPSGKDGHGLPGINSKVQIPEEAERRKINDILDQLRKKSGELSRPDYELDYYRRLMRQF